MTKPFYITTPLYYVNAKPHIGHAYTNILCDMFARYHRFRGENVFFLTGTDEHGTKIDRAAREQKKEPKIYVDEMVPQFKSLWQLIGIKYDYFIRTTDAAHKQIVQNILNDLEKRGEIYRASYKGWYCTPCESFWTKLQLKAGKCPDCGRDVQELSEENYFFKLSKYQKWLIEYIETHPEFIRPEIRKNEILGFLREPLEDLCITRPKARLAWGIDFPSSKEHVVYVWFDALINYVSAMGFTVDQKKFKQFWPADLHMVGKDILRQHAVYWPIMLKAMGVEMPKTVVAHGWWTMSGTKVSKSSGNVVDPIELVKRYGSDAFRYYLLHEVTLGADGSYSEDLLVERFNSDLANDLGNLVMRTTSMLERYFNSQIPDTKNVPEYRSKLSEITEKHLERIHAAMTQTFQPHVALNIIWDELIRYSNRLIDQKKPWVLAKENRREDLADLLVHLLELIRMLGVLLAPFLPVSSEKILRLFGLSGTPSVQDLKSGGLKTGIKVQKGEALFPKVE